MPGGHRPCPARPLWRNTSRSRSAAGRRGLHREQPAVTTSRSGRGGRSRDGPASRRGTRPMRRQIAARRGRPPRRRSADAPDGGRGHQPDVPGRARPRWAPPAPHPAAASPGSASTASAATSDCRERCRSCGLAGTRGPAADPRRGRSPGWNAPRRIRQHLRARRRLRRARATASFTPPAPNAGRAPAAAESRSAPPAATAAAPATRAHRGLLRWPNAPAIAARSGARRRPARPGSSARPASAWPPARRCTGGSTSRGHDGGGFVAERLHRQLPGRGRRCPRRRPRCPRASVPQPPQPSFAASGRPACS